MNKKIPRKWHEPFNTLAQNDKELIPEKITTKNLFLLYLIHKLRCISPKELSGFLDQTINHSLYDLINTEKLGLTYSKYIDFYGCKQRVFFTTDEGIEKTAEILGTELHTLDRYSGKYVPNFYSKNENEIKPHLMPHFLATNDFYLTLLKNGIAVDWKDSRYNALFDGDIRKAPIRVDASYTIGKDFYGIEQDMGTTYKQKFLTKLSNYADYFPTFRHDSSTIYFSINMGKDLNSKELDKLPKKFTENEKLLKEMRAEKRRYVEARKLVREYPAPPPRKELEEKKQFAELALNNPVISNKAKAEIRKTLAEVNKFLDGDYPKPEDNLRLHEQAINNPTVSRSERRKAQIKKEIILTYKEMGTEEELTEKINDLTLRMRELSDENNKMKEDREREILIKKAHKRRNTVISYIDFHIKNKENVNTLLDLFCRGLDMYMDETILLAEFAARQIREETILDTMTRRIEKIIKNWVGGRENYIDCSFKKKAKYDNFMFTVDYGIEISNKNKVNKSVYIDVFDICSNNIASVYRFYEYLKTKNDEWRFFENRLTICLVDSGERIIDLRKNFPHEPYCYGNNIEDIWFYTDDKQEILCASNKDIKEIELDKDLLMFLNTINE